MMDENRTTIEFQEFLDALAHAPSGAGDGPRNDLASRLRGLVSDLRTRFRQEPGA